MPSHHVSFRLPGLLALLLLSGCAGQQSIPRQVPATLYESAIINADSGQIVTVSTMAQQIANADVVVVGEYHGHQAAHLLQSQLQTALYRQNPQQLLAMEPFDLDHQVVIDDYLAGKLGEEELIDDADGWNNYKASYRPLVEFARHRQLPVIAANAPAGVVRCVGRQGPVYLQSLSPTQRSLLPKYPFRDVPGYRNKFVDTMGGDSHGDTSDARLENAYQAQLLRDNTMAERVMGALKDYPDHQILVITGTFHSEERLGLVGALEQRKPGLNVIVISPMILDSSEGAELTPGEEAAKGDYLYFIRPLPEPYRDEDRRFAAMKKQFSQARERNCR